MKYNYLVCMNGGEFGWYEAESREAALDNAAQDLGYENIEAYEEYLAEEGDDEHDLNIPQEIDDPVE
ncbi:hypothetical protein CCP4SC76_810005 [Gammaproteobacteria bacterium]